MRAKIAFIGTHGVGKTILTFMLASELRKRRVDADVAYENSRFSPFPINEETTLEGQMWILASQWKSELEASTRSQVVVCDRSVLDNYAYMVRKCGRQEYLHPFIKQWLASYSLLFLVPIIEDDVQKDMKRSVSRDFQTQIHETVYQLIEEFGIGHRVCRLSEKRSGHLTEVIRHMRGVPALGSQIEEAITHLQHRRILRKESAHQLNLF